MITMKHVGNRQAAAHFNRRDFLGFLGASFWPGGSGSPAKAGEAASLRALAATTGLSFGTAVGHEVFDDEVFRELVIKQASIIVPDRYLKFDWLRPDEKTFNFTEADTLLAGARSNGLAMRGHNLIWNDWPPDWLKKAPAAKLSYILDQHIETVMAHYAGKLQSWDVVNEPFVAWGNDPGGYRQGPWFSAMGPDYIFKAFKRAAMSDPGSTLVLNEAWTERSDVYGLAVRKSVLRLIDEMKDKGLKIDAVGLQGHLDPSVSYDDAGFADFLHQLEERGLSIYITELDINDAPYDGSFAERDRKCAERVTSFLKHALSVKAVSMVMCWGLSDRYSWYREPSVLERYKATRLPRPTPYDDEFQPKPMRDAMAQAFTGRWLQ
jgi:endo-1,4-beta-xylanase